MKDIYKEAIISHTAIEDVVENKLVAHFDGANGLIELTKTNQLNGDKLKLDRLVISFDELKKINWAIDTLERK